MDRVLFVISGSVWGRSRGGIHHHHRVRREKREAKQATKCGLVPEKKKRGIVEKRERARSTSGLHPPSPSELLQLAIAKQKQDRGEEGETEVSGASTSMMKS